MSLGTSLDLATPKSSLPPDLVIFGGSPAMLAMRERVEKLASANIPILIQGESGTGKEVITRLIHQLSPWGSGPFVKVNCPAIPGTLMESELFGYERGAFTGAYGTKAGRVEMASRGTLFLDEIGELDLDLQAKLLQVLQDGQFCRIGAQEDKKLEARVVCATNRILENEIATGAFRQDLFYRINVVSITLPPLRERAGDIPLLADYFIGVYNEKFNRRVKPMSASGLKTLQQCPWPGNIRELENVIRRYVIFGQEDAVLADITQVAQPAFEPMMQITGDVSLKKITRDAVAQLERKVILQVLQTHHWNRKKTARALKISYRALLYKIQGAGLSSMGPIPPGPLEGVPAFAAASAPKTVS